jgi:hypothetical protein
VRYVGLEWALRMAQWCALAPGGETVGEGGSRIARAGAGALGKRLESCRARRLSRFALRLRDVGQDADRACWPGRGRLCSFVSSP